MTPVSAYKHTCQCGRGPVCTYLAVSVHSCLPAKSSLFSPDVRVLKLPVHLTQTVLHLATRLLKLQKQMGRERGGARGKGKGRSRLDEITYLLNVLVCHGFSLSPLHGVKLVPAELHVLELLVCCLLQLQDNGAHGDHMGIT